MKNEKTNPLESQEMQDAASTEPTMEALLQEQATFLERLKAREVVWIKVIQIQDANVQVDIGEKQEGVIPSSEFDPLPAVGSRIPAILVKPGRDNKPAVLSHKKAREQAGWKQAQKAFETKARVHGVVVSSVKGGFMVDVAGVGAFLPASLADLRPVRKPQAMIGTGVRCYILEMHQDKKQLVLSRKAVLEEEAKKRREKLMAMLKVGDVRIGKVIHTVPSTGAFIDLGGLEGLLATADVAWKEPAKALATLTPGHKMRVKILRIDAQNGKVGLGAKQLLPNPADALKKRYPPKTTVSGKITEVKKEDGVRIQLPNGVTAFCPAAELVQQDKGLPPVWPAVGDEVHAVTIGVRQDTFELSVSIRRYEEIQDRKRIAHYLKAAPKLTLGQILTSEEEK